MYLKKKSKKNTCFLLTVIILMQLIRIVYSFIFIKEDYHSDEIWSFGLSNSYYEPFIFQSDDHKEFINNDNWISSDVMKDYLVVDEIHRFSYDSVYYNQVHDYHPLYIILLFILYVLFFQVNFHLGMDLL